MSAFMCSDRHLTVLATYAVMHGLSGCTDDTRGKGAMVREVFIVLARENMASLDARYPGDQGDAIGWPDPKAALEQHDPIVIIKACHCYAYQACEHRGWEDSRARRIIRDIEAHAVRNLPGYDAAPWGL